MFPRYFEGSLVLQRLFLFKRPKKPHALVLKSRIIEAALVFFRPIILKSEEFFKESYSYKLMDYFYGKTKTD